MFWAGIIASDAAWDGGPSDQNWAEFAKDLDFIVFVLSVFSSVAAAAVVVDDDDDGEEVE